MNTAFAESQNEPVESTSTQMSNGETQAKGLWKNKWGSRGRCPLAAGGTPYMPFKGSYVPPAAGGEPPPDPHLFLDEPLAWVSPFDIWVEVDSTGSF